MTQGSDPNTDVEHVDLQSLDVAEQKRQELLHLFPEVRTEGGKIDFDRLRACGKTVKDDDFHLIEASATTRQTIPDRPMVIV